MKQVAFTLLLAVQVLCAVGQDTTYWKSGGGAAFTFSQVSLTNWAAGGNNSISVNGYFNVFANYRKANVSWGNNLEMGYGIIRQGEAARAQKTDDILIATTQFGYRLNGDKLYWSSLLDFRTQFYRGVNADGDRISEFMAPGYLLVATGLDWKPSPVLSATYAPVTGKFTFVRNQELANAGAFGVTPGIPDPVNPAVFLSAGSRHRAELGSFLKVMFNKENLLPNVTVASKLELFSNYLKDFGNVDVNWQNMVSMKVNNLLTVNWQSQLIYDHDIKIEAFDDAGLSLGTHPRTQFKSVFGVGISYRFGATK